MGSYAGLSIRKQEILCWKNGLASFVRKLFTKEDFLDLIGDEAANASQELGLGYSEDYFGTTHPIAGVSDVKTIRQWLLICGFGLEYAKGLFNEAIKKAESFFEDADEDMKGYYREDLNKIKDIVDLSRKPNEPVYDHWNDDVSDYMNDWTLFLSCIYNDNLRDDDKVVLDLAELINGGWLDDDSDFSREDFVLLKDATVSDLPIILTEGTTDRSILSKAFRIFYPELVHYIKFLNRDFKPEGGVANILKMARSFASAGISNRILIVLDNDSAAISTIKKFGNKYPSNIRVTTYPYNPTLQDYPTIGPQGELRMDINGLAGSIEMYLGQGILTNEAGGIEKIQWTGYMENIKQYQGSLINKAAVQKRFNSLTDDSIKKSSDLEIVCDHIIAELGKIPNIGTFV